jgi:hypothetical protein
MKLSSNYQAKNYVSYILNYNLFFIVFAQITIIVQHLELFLWHHK